MKRAGTSVIVAMILAALLVVSVTAALFGDANNDGNVRSGDARTILRHAAKVEIQTDPFILKLMDVDENGSIKASDARLALRMASRLETTKEYVESVTGVILVEPTTESSTVPPIPSDPIIPTSKVPDEPTTAAPVEPTAEVPVEPTTEAPVEPTTEAPVEPTLPDEPTTEAPVEPTTEAPVEPTTEAPVEPTTEAPVEPTTEAPDEPTTVPVEPTTEVPVEPTTVPVEPTTAPVEPTEPVEGIEYYDSFYIDADVVSVTDGRETVQRVKVAASTEEVKGAFGKNYTLHAQYVRTDSISPGHELGVLVRDDLNTLRTGTKKTFYMIDYEANEYVSIDGDVLELAGVDFDEMMGDDPLDSMRIPVFTDLSALNATEEDFDGKTYQVVTIDKDEIRSKYFVEYRDGKYYPVIVESYSDGKLDTRMVIYGFSTDAAAYTAVPTGMKAYPIRALTVATDLVNAMPFFQRLGIM